MTQEEAIFRLGKWLGSNDCDASREYLRMLSEQAAAIQSKLEPPEQTAIFAREQVHAIIEMLEV